MTNFIGSGMPLSQAGIDVTAIPTRNGRFR
jgi:hypothetical protein